MGNVESALAGQLPSDLMGYRASENAALGVGSGLAGSPYMFNRLDYSMAKDRLNQQRWAAAQMAPSLQTNQQAARNTGQYLLQYNIAERDRQIAEQNARNAAASAAWVASKGGGTPPIVQSGGAPAAQRMPTGPFTPTRAVSPYGTGSATGGGPSTMDMLTGIINQFGGVGQPKANAATPGIFMSQNQLPVGATYTEGDLPYNPYAGQGYDYQWGNTQWANEPEMMDFYFGE